YPKYIDSSEKKENEQTYPREWKPKDVVRTGIQVTPNLYYNSIDMPSCASAIPPTVDSIPVHIKTYWYCQGCKIIFSFNKIQATEHALEKCSSLVNHQKSGPNLIND
ncbi:hypothetical protein BD408DRAFT_343635, partial [Parasitella parasitica]